MQPSELLTEQEFDLLEELLDSPAFAGKAMHLDELQGFLCAIASGPETVMPSRWLPEVLGAGTNYETLEQAQTIVSLVMRLYNEVAQILFSGEPLNLILYEVGEGGSEFDFKSWCDGYVYGSQIGDADWFEAAGADAEELSELLQPFLILNDAIKNDMLAHNEPWMDEGAEQKLYEQCREFLPEAVHEVYQFWLAKRMPAKPVRRESPKVGRNDPCPCGSGKKFKHCCGDEPTFH